MFFTWVGVACVLTSVPILAGLFPLGQITATAAALALLREAGVSPTRLLRRHRAENIESPAGRVAILAGVDGYLTPEAPQVERERHAR